MNREPKVDLTNSDYDGSYFLARSPSRPLVAHNATSWSIVETILIARGSADFRDMAVAVRNHRHYGTDEGHPQEFIKYCIRRGWLKRAA